MALFNKEDQATPDPSATALEERRKKFGLWADSTITIEGNIAKIVIDDAFPDDEDKITIQTSREKLMAAIGGKGAARVLAECKHEGLKFFGE